MPRSSPAVDRVLSVLNFLAEHPRQSFSLSQIMRSLNLSRATCYRILSELSDRGYLFRNADKKFVLGPVLLAIGRNTEQTFSPLDVARLELRKLADEFDVVAMASFAEGDQIVNRERAASRTHLGWAPPKGVKYPFHPYGLLFKVTAPQDEVEAWLDKTRPPLSEHERVEMREKLAFARKHGYTAVVYDEARSEPEQDQYWRKRHANRLIKDLDPEASYRLHYMDAPVTDGRGDVAFLLAMHSFSGEYSGERVAAMAARLCESCRRITTFIGGRASAARE